MHASTIAIEFQRIGQFLLSETATFMSPSGQVAGDIGKSTLHGTTERQRCRILVDCSAEILSHGSHDVVFQSNSRYLVRIMMARRIGPSLMRAVSSRPMTTNIADCISSLSLTTPSILSYYATY